LFSVASYKQIQQLRIRAEKWRNAVVAATRQLGYSAERTVEANLAAALRSRDPRSKQMSRQTDARALAALSSLVAELNALRTAGRALDVAVDSEGESCVASILSLLSILFFAHRFFSLPSTSPSQQFGRIVRRSAQGVYCDDRVGLRLFHRGAHRARGDARRPAPRRAAPGGRAGARI
jgi:hypothetical protein